ncbi:MAG: hypothetical protein IJ773_09145 [Lachnospiraceae bacterium]|nr:hypothetical protein [Lachnospiraceae bacterium]
MDNNNKKSASGAFAACLLLIAAARGALELFLYIKDGRTSFDPNYSMYAIVGMGVGIFLALVGLVSRLRTFYFLAYLAFLYAFIHYVVSQVNLIANILYGVDGSTFPTVFYVTIAASFAACLFALIAGIVKKPRVAVSE